MQDELSRKDIDFLKDIVDTHKADRKSFNRISARKNEDRRDYHNDKDKGWMIRWQDCMPLEIWYRKRFGVRGPFGGQLAMLKQPLGVHADVLWDVPNHIPLKEDCTTRYSVIETDCKDMLHTYVFDQYVDRDKWTGLKDGTDAIIGLTDEPIGNKQRWGLDHLYPNANALGLTLKTLIPLPLGRVVGWDSHHLHSGQSFMSCGGSWKLHLTLITTTASLTR